MPERLTCTTAAALLAIAAERLMPDQNDGTVATRYAWNAAVTACCYLNGAVPGNGNAFLPVTRDQAQALIERARQQLRQQRRVPTWAPRFLEAAEAALRLRSDTGARRLARRVQAVAEDLDRWMTGGPALTMRPPMPMAIVT